MPILNKAGIFNSNAILKGIVGQQNGISIDKIMNSGKILVCNLSKGLVGEDVCHVLGSLLTTSIKLLLCEEQRLSKVNEILFMVFVGECHVFITSSFVSMLSEVRKYMVAEK